MDISNYFRICVYFCLGLIIFTLCINLVSALNIFTSIDTGVSSTGSSNDIFTQITGLSGGMQFIWASVLTIGGFLAIVMAKMLQSTSIIGIYLFSSVFWTSYSRFVTTININSFIPSNFLIIFTVGLLFIWGAAVISMLTNVS